MTHKHPARELKLWRSAMLLLQTISLLIVLTAPAKAQMIQPTGQSSPATRNPQTPLGSGLAAPTTDLQGNLSSRVLGVSINQLAESSLRVVTPGTAQIAYEGSSPEAFLNETENRSNTGQTKSSSLIGIVTGGSTLGLVVLAIYLGAKHKTT